MARPQKATAKAVRELCIFCPNPRTNKRGEHVWDDWLNREDGKTIYDPSTTWYYGREGQLIRSHPSVGMHVTLPLVCDHCNNTWMSDLSSLAKVKLEPIIRRDKATDFDDFDILVISAFAFLKSAVLDWSVTDGGRKPSISREACLRFRTSMADADPAVPVFPDGLQVWIASYRRTRKMEALVSIEELTGVRQFKGYRILLITYVVGSFIFQLTCPKWTKATRNHPALPFARPIADDLSVAIWPDVNTAYWPPFAHVQHRTYEAFRQRFRKLRVWSQQPTPRGH